MRKSSGLPNLPSGREGLGTSELEKMHACSEPNMSRQKLHKNIRIHGAAYVQRTVGKQAKVNLLRGCAQTLLIAYVPTTYPKLATGQMGRGPGGALGGPGVPAKNPTQALEVLEWMMGLD